jgi:hypothetical protein
VQFLPLARELHRNKHHHPISFFSVRPLTGLFPCFLAFFFFHRVCCAHVSFHNSFSLSFVGTAAVGFMVKEGMAPTRSKAVGLGRLLQDKGYLRHVTDQSKFKDAQL